MAILKKGYYEGDCISKIDIKTLNLALEENTDTINFDKEEYLEILENAKKEGYEEGLSKGYNKGYNQGLDAFEQDKENLYAMLDEDKHNLATFLNQQSLSYINNFKNNLNNLLVDCLDKLFLKALNNEDVMSVYISNLLMFLSSNYKEFTIKANEFTIEFIEKNITIDMPSYEVDCALDNYDFTIITQNEHLEYFLNDEFEKIKELFS